MDDDRRTPENQTATPVDLTKSPTLPLPAPSTSRPALPRVARASSSRSSRSSRSSTETLDKGKGKRAAPLNDDAHTSTSRGKRRKVEQVERPESDGAPTDEQLPVLNEPAAGPSSSATTVQSTVLSVDDAQDLSLVNDAAQASTSYSMQIDVDESAAPFSYDPYPYSAQSSAGPSFVEGSSSTSGAGPSSLALQSYPMPSPSTYTPFGAETSPPPTAGPSQPPYRQPDPPYRQPSSPPPPVSEPLSAYTCPICFGTPTNATLTPCGHIACGACLYVAVQTGMARGGEFVMGGAGGARCPVCRAPIPGWDGRGGGVIGLKTRMVITL
ncbi:hypothetical protein PLICRDRAFT_361966 [Plicaturopsis crispa FD-325 SS-3]|uniref:RING-type domain-containing protein n=1 Tax=Plicaturopsis crispa FD-325 SS-3 TaxID=944288 RepID=A0A0C9SR51_PLICR|nr:hypothetical protein PLICRDRAFT_361966 [Plicaturopsis crispa FD-325 SS-3]